MNIHSRLYSLCADEEGSEMSEIPPKGERLNEIFQRMANAPLCTTFEEAYKLLCDTMDEVEDEMTPYPNEPDRWRELPRLFPPQMDRMSTVQQCDQSVVRRFDSLRHLTYIAENGAMEIRALRKAEALFAKDDKDGNSVCGVCPALQEENL